MNLGPEREAPLSPAFDPLGMALLDAPHPQSIVYRAYVSFRSG